MGIICFLLHGGLILHHTYFTASKHNTRVFPKTARGRGIIMPPERWHNFLDLNRWDSYHYETILLRGYHDSRDPSKPALAIQWYPGYPLLAKGIYRLTGWKVTFIFSLLRV